MKTKYLSTFLAGTGELVQETLKKALENAEIHLLLDGIITYSTTTDIEKLLKLKFLTNTFIVVKSFEDLTGRYFKPMFQWTKRHGFEEIAAQLSKLPIKTFRVMLHDNGKFVTYNKYAIADIEKRVSADLGLELNPHQPDTEIWFMHRKEGYGFVLIRITKESKSEHKNKGQLRPELANLLCVLANPAKNDVLLDPFAGYGTIVAELVKLPHAQIIAFEKKQNMQTISGILKIDPRTKFYFSDFFANTLPANSISKIVTDPPWGLFDKTLNVGEFYSKVFTEFDRLLAEKGEVVLLLDRAIEIKQFLPPTRFELKNAFSVLVSGKKAAIYLLSKRM